jgi:hypothetical protein
MTNSSNDYLYGSKIKSPQRAPGKQRIFATFVTFVSIVVPIGEIINFQAGAPGFEPRSTDPKSGVLPLHYAPMFHTKRV